GWINEHFINDGQPINQPSPGVPACPGQPPGGGGNPPSGGAPCAYESCNGGDPDPGCDAQPPAVLEELNANGYTLQLRYSASCHAVWGRAYGYPPIPYACHGYTPAYVVDVEESTAP